MDTGHGFVCQRCGKNLDVDDSLLLIDRSLLERGDLEFDKIFKSGASPSSPPDASSKEDPKRAISTSTSFLSLSKPSVQNRATSYIDVPALSSRMNKNRHTQQVTGTPIPKLNSPLLPSMRSMSSNSLQGMDDPQQAELAASFQQMSFDTNSINMHSSHHHHQLYHGKSALHFDVRKTVSNLKYIRQPKAESGLSDKEMSVTDEVFASRLFQLVSNQIGIDFPLCVECSKSLSAEIDEELAMLEAQQSSYSSFFDQLEQREKRWSQSHNDLEAEIRRMEEEEKMLRGQLVACDNQRMTMQQELDYLKNEADRLASFEERYWQHFDELHANASALVDERDACRVQTAVLTETLEILKKTQIINDAFHIWHDGHFGTINTFRLGRLPSQPVDWNEINAAWGLAVLLLANMAKRIGFTFSTYKPIPCGSCSKMERTDNSSSYELFGSSDISLGRLFWYRRFDNGMVAFLVCLKEMGDYAEARDKTFRLPHKMEKDKIGDMSIKIQFNNEETWTKSLKYMLTNLKWLLAWIVKTEAEQGGESTSIGNNVRGRARP